MIFTSEHRPADLGAWLVSMIVNPLILPPILLGWLAGVSGAGREEIWSIFGVSLVLFFLVPVCFLFLMVRRGEAASIDVRDRSKRMAPLLAGTIMTLVSLPLLWMTADTVRIPILPVTFCLTINTVFVLLITTRFKMSIHTAGMAGFIVMLGVLSRAIPGAQIRPAVILATAVLLPVVMWARIRSGAHSAREVFWGGLFGVLLPAIEMSVLVGGGWLNPG